MASEAGGYAWPMGFSFASYFIFFILFLFLRGGIVGIDAFLLHNVEED